MCEKKKYGILVAECSEKWGGADAIGQLFIEVFKRHESEQWEYFKACESELPDINRINEFAGFITSGSIKSANDDVDWMRNLEDFYRDVKTKQEQNDDAPKLVGICYGHQIMNKAFGGIVSNNASGKFILQQHDIHVSNDLKEKDFYKNCLAGKDSFIIIQSHGEEVSVLPPDAKSFGDSDTCSNEIVLYDNNKILTFQGHCEITIKDVVDKIFPAICKKDNFNEDDQKTFWKSMEKKNENHKCVALIRSFLGLETQDS